MFYFKISPNDPAKRQNLTLAKDLPKSAQEAHRAITDGLGRLALAGELKSRANVLETLEKAGFEIARTTQTSISLKNPEAGGRNIRLKGALYEQDFRFSQDLQADIAARSREHRATGEERLSRARQSYQRGIEAKWADNSRRHSRPAITHEQGGVQSLSVELGGIIGSSISPSWSERLPSQENRSAMGGVSGSQGQHRQNGQAQQADTVELLRAERRGEDSLRSRAGGEPRQMGQQWRIQGDFATNEQITRGNHERDGNRAIERARVLREQSEADRNCNAERLTAINRASEELGSRKQAIKRNAENIRERLGDFGQAVGEAERRLAATERNHRAANQVIEQSRKAKQATLQRHSPKM